MWTFGTRRGDSATRTVAGWVAAVGGTLLVAGLLGIGAPIAAATGGHPKPTATSTTDCPTTSTPPPTTSTPPPTTSTPPPTPTTTTTSPPTTTTTSPPTTPPTRATVSASCVGVYTPDPTVGVTTISWTAAPKGARVKIVGYVTEYRDFTDSSGSLLLPGLPLAQADLEIYKISLVDSEGNVLAGPVGLTVCTTTSTATTGTTTGTSTTTGTTTTTGTHTGTGTATSPSTSSTTTSSSSTSTTATGKSTIGKKAVGPKRRDGDEPPTGANGLIVAVGLGLMVAAVGLRRPRLSVQRGKYHA